MGKMDERKLDEDEVSFAPDPLAPPAPERLTTTETSSRKSLPPFCPLPPPPPPPVANDDDDDEWCADPSTAAAPSGKDKNLLGRAAG
jgi:hypothetical protein